MQFSTRRHIGDFVIESHRVEFKCKFLPAFELFSIQANVSALDLYTRSVRHSSETVIYVMHRLVGDDQQDNGETGEGGTRRRKMRWKTVIDLN